MSSKKPMASHADGLNLIIQSTRLSPKSTSSASGVWYRALSLYQNRLSKADQHSIIEVTQMTTLDRESLTKILQPLFTKYTNSKCSRLLEVINPTVDHILSFSAVFTICLQAHPNPAALIWGGLSLVLEVASRSMRLLENIVAIVEDLSKSLPIFERWLRLFPGASHAELHDSLVETLLEYITFLVETIIYLRNSAPGNFFRTLFVPTFRSRYDVAQKNLKRLTKSLHLQVYTASIEVDQRQHKELRTILEDRATVTSNTSITPPRPLYYLQNMTKSDQFFGRSKELDDMCLKLHDSNHTFQSVAIHGMGGCGKSQLALEYVHRHLREYHVVLWLHADSKAKIEDQLGQVGIELGLSKEQKDVARCHQKVLKWLSVTHHRWLVIFDNVDSLDNLDDLFARSPSGSVIITTRNPMARGEDLAAKEISLQCFDTKEGVDFLKSFLDLPLSRASSEDHSFRQIVEIFAGLPLGLKVAASVMKRKHYSAGAFLFICMQPAQELDAADTLGSSKSLCRLWDVSLSILTKEAQDLLDKLTFLDPAIIPFTLFEASDGYPSVSSSLRTMKTFHNALECLTGQSIVTVDGAKQNISVHRYLQDVLFRRLMESTERYESSLDSTLTLLRKACPRASFQSHISPEHWKVRRQYASHLQFLEGRLNQSVPNNSANLLIDLLSDAVFYYYETGQYDTALSAISRLETFITKNNILANPSTLALLYFTTGNINNECNDAEAGILAYRNAITQLELSASTNATEPHNSDQHNQNLASIHSSLGNSLTGLSRFPESKSHHETAIALILSTSSPAPKTVGRLYANLGSCLLWSGDLNGAESVLHTSLLAYDRKLGCTLYALGNVYLAQGRVEKGFELHLETLEVFAGMFGVLHPNTADSCYKVGSLCGRGDNERGGLGDAEKYLRKAKETYERCWNEQNRDMKALYARAQGRLGQVLLQRYGEEHEEGQELVRIAFDFLKTTRGDGFKCELARLESDFNQLIYYWSR